MSNTIRVAQKLNIIEILWRFIKYEWISLEAYQSLSKLEKELEMTLNNVGEKYVINFNKKFKENVGKLLSNYLICSISTHAKVLPIFYKVCLLNNS